MGGLLGVGLGVLVQLAFPWLLAKLVNIDTTLHLQWRTVVTGLLAGVLTTLLFTLPPLLDIRGVRPVLIFRRAVEDVDDPFVSAVFRKLRKNAAQLSAAVLILLGLTAIAMTLSDSATVGRYFSLGLVSVLLVLLLASAGVLNLLRTGLRRSGFSLPSSLRHGLANLYRPGNPSAALLAALGMGVMQIMTVYLVQQAVVSELHISSAPDLPNVFLIDITPEEITGVRALLKAQPTVTAVPEFLPVVSSRILEIDGVEANKAKVKNFPKRMLQAISLTYADAVPPGTMAVQGKWWDGAQAADAGKHPLVAVNQPQAERLGLHLGSTITFAAQDARFTAVVVTITKSNGQHAFSRAEFVLPERALEGLPVIWYGGVHATPSRVDELQRAMYHAYPTVTVINVAQALETVRQVVVQITYVVQFLAAFSIFAGVVILASSIAGTRYRRVREVVVLKTLGATRGRIATIFSIEFAVLGMVAAVVGIGFANLIADLILRKLTVAYRFHWGWNLLALVLTGLLTVGTGWAASFRVLGQKPLEVLREE